MSEQAAQAVADLLGEAQRVIDLCPNCRRMKVSHDMPCINHWNLANAIRDVRRAS